MSDTRTNYLPGKATIEDLAEYLNSRERDQKKRIVGLGAIYDKNDPNRGRNFMEWTWDLKVHELHESNPKQDLVIERVHHGTDRAAWENLIHPFLREFDLVERCDIYLQEGIWGLNTKSERLEVVLLRRLPEELQLPETPVPPPPSGSNYSVRGDFSWVTKADLTPYLSPALGRHAQHFVDAGVRYQLDPCFLAAISKFETGNGTSHAFKVKRNAMGVSPDGGGPATFASVRDSIVSMAKSLSRPGGHYEGANTIEEIGAIYSPVGAGNDVNKTNHLWPATVKRFYNEMVKGRSNASAPSPSPGPGSGAGIPQVAEPTSYLKALGVLLAKAGVIPSSDNLTADQIDPVVRRFQKQYNQQLPDGAAPLGTDGDPGEDTLWALQQPHTLDANAQLDWAKVPADKWGDGYDYFKLRKDAAKLYEALYRDVKDAGGQITSHGGYRSLSASVGPGRSSKSMHYTGLAFDLQIDSGFKNPTTDPFVVTKEPGDRYWTVWNRATKGEALTLQAKYWKNKKVFTTQVSGTFINFTELCRSHGFYPISARSSFPGNYIACEWWHFQANSLLQPGVSQFGIELLKVKEYDEQKVDDYPKVWKNKKLIFGERWN